MRCWFAYCNKLFKDVAFLKKHVTLKHEFFCQEVTLRNAEPYMRARYDAEDYLTRPLPPVEVEVQGGTELRSVLDILQKHGPRYAVAGGFRGDQSRSQRGHFDDRGGRGGRGGGRGRDGRRSFDQPRDFAPRPPGPPPDFQQPSTYGAPGDNAVPQRKISTYMDVDAPKVSICTSLYMFVYVCICISP